MSRLEKGDPSARTDVRSTNELGIIANRFNLMAAQLQRAAEERESLIDEIQGLNTGLQSRIQEALAALQSQNHELEKLMAGNALLREELSQQERMAVAGQLTAAFAHEVGTPLNLVNSHLQLLQGQSDVGEKSRERLAVIHAQIERVGDIVRKMMDLTRRPGIQQEPVALGPLVADLQRLWSPTLAIHNISFGWEAPDPCVLYVDRKQMEQLFINMVNNSVDAMPEGGHLQLSAEREPATARWLVRVSDTGTGIAPELLQKVFRPMFTTKPEGQGTGLGLAICREIVRAHGGEIHIESEEGQGTTMSFSLPALPDPT
jgi:signal transduction histidine kinase